MRTSHQAPRGLPALLAAALLLVGGAAAAAGNVYLAQGKVLFQGLEYEKCVQRMEQASLWKDSTIAERAQVELYSGLCQYSLGERETARSHFQVALQLDPTLKLPDGVSPRIAEDFEAQAAPIRAEAAAARAADAEKAQVAELEQGAQNAIVGDPSLETSEPRGRGPLPWIFGGAAVLAGAGGGYLGLQAQQHAQTANDRTTFHNAAQELGSQAKQEAALANVGFAVAGLALGAAVTSWVFEW